MFDIEHAGTCLALDEATACVMHLMRALEVALNAVGLGIGLPDALVQAKTSWEHLLTQMKAKIATNKASKIPRGWHNKHFTITRTATYMR